MTPRSSDLPPETLGIRHIALKVKDLAAAERFYVDILGFAVEWRPDPDNLYLAKDKDSLALHTAQFSEGGSLDHFGIMLKRPADVDAWADYLKKKGFEPEKEPKTHRDGARSFYMRDPEGNLIQFIHHPPIATAA
ncbi:MAG TPA: VOC family protein [Elusimicrobiota bacterium]|nr:VOC family protein [Elusimicrobiota bacterium]